MPVVIESSNLPEFPQKLAEKLIHIRERSGRTWAEFAQEVNARDGTEIAAYENNEGDLPISVLFAYARFAGIPIENIIDDDRDLWFGHLRNHKRPQKAVPSLKKRVKEWAKDQLAFIGLIVVVVFAWHFVPKLVGLAFMIITDIWKELFVS